MAYIITGSDKSLRLTSFHYFYLALWRAVMGLLDLIKRKKSESVEIKTEQRQVTELERLCGDDKETYEALFNTMFLDPRKIGVTMEEAAETARKFEKGNDLVRAKVWYQIAGGLAIYKGDVKKVIEYFSKCEKLSGVSYPILKNPEKAVAKAQEYYREFLAPAS
jgi:ribosomal protein S19